MVGKRALQQFFKKQVAQHFGTKLKIITSLHLCIIQNLIYVYQYSSSQNAMLMTLNDPTSNCVSQTCVLTSIKKKYSKVNQSLRERFLQLIIQHNMSIKDASQTLNINYSSAKAILAMHRKKINEPKKECKKGQQTVFRSLEQSEDLFSRFSIICSTGGRETSSFGNIGKVKQIHKSSISPVIIIRMEKEGQSLEHTSNSLSN